MKLIFWIGLIGLFAFEVFNVYFIMPMPGSQRMDSISIAYFLYNWRWMIRGLFALMIIVGLVRGSLAPEMEMAADPSALHCWRSSFIWPISKWRPIICFTSQRIW